MSLSSRLKTLLDENPSKTQAGLARATGAKPASISDWVNDRTKSINSKYLTHAANYLGVSSDWLATGKGPKHSMELSGTGTIGSFSASATLDAYKRPSLMEALAEISKAMLAADDLARIQAKPLLAHLIENPEQADKIIPRLVALLDGEPLTTETKDFVHAKQHS